LNKQTIIRDNAQFIVHLYIASIIHKRVENKTVSSHNTPVKLFFYLIIGRTQLPTWFIVYSSIAYLNTIVNGTTDAENSAFIRIYVLKSKHYTAREAMLYNTEYTPPTYIGIFAWIIFTLSWNGKWLRGPTDAFVRNSKWRIEVKYLPKY